MKNGGRLFRKVFRVLETALMHFTSQILSDIFGVILVRIFLIRSISPCSVRIRENADQSNSE